MPRRRLTLLAALAAAGLLAACGGDADEPASTLSRAKRDSVLAESDLPGAGAVKGALEAADTARVRADRAESAVGKTGRLPAVERATILATLAECNDNRTQAAKKLGISRRALIYKIRAMEGGG